jgi:hypothetical protein
MYDTYGEDYFTIRGFVEGGWNSLQNNDGDLSKEGKLFHLSTLDFHNEIIPELNSKDIIIFPVFLEPGKSSLQIPTWVHQVKDSKKALIVIGNSYEISSETLGEKFDAVISVHLNNFYLSEVSYS